MPLLSLLLPFLSSFSTLFLLPTPFPLPFLFPPPLLSLLSLSPFPSPLHPSLHFLPQNIDFMPTILSRFDMIFIVKDEHNVEKDTVSRDAPGHHT